MIRSTRLPRDIDRRLATIDRAFERFPDVVFAYVFRSFGGGRPGPLSDVDVANHVVADRQLRVESTYAEIFDVLEEAGLIDPALCEDMARMARFRNILVHDSARIDPAVVIGILQERLNDFRRFREAALTWI